MKLIIVYDTIYGNTQRIAEAIKEGLGSGHESELVRVEEAKTDMIENTDVLIVGSPTHGGWFSESVKTFLDTLSAESLRGIYASSFDTSIPSEDQKFLIKSLTKLFGNAAPRISKELRQKGATVIGSEIFFVLGRKGPIKEGEIERAREWAAGLMEKIV